MLHLIGLISKNLNKNSTFGMFPLCLPLRPSVLKTFPLSFSSFSLKKKKCHTEQARRELRRLKHEARSKLAVSVIWACWQGTKVFTSTSVCHPILHLTHLTPQYVPEVDHDQSSLSSSHPLCMQTCPGPHSMNHTCTVL